MIYMIYKMRKNKNPVNLVNHVEYLWQVLPQHGDGNKLTWFIFPVCKILFQLNDKNQRRGATTYAKLAALIPRPLDLLVRQFATLFL